MKISRLTISAAASAFLLAGCMGPAGMTDPNNPNRNTQAGAASGAALGALVGIATGDTKSDRKRGALIGAAAGAGVGGLIGRQLDQQEAELRAQMNNNVGIVNTGQSLVVTMPQDILFATDSATLSGGLQSDLRTVASSLNRYPNSTVRVVGHTDSTGDAAYNQTLSERRAQAVASVLVNSGVASGRISATGRGESQPVADNLSATGKAQNRRVEITIVPNG